MKLTHWQLKAWCDVSIKRKDGEISFIADVLYIPRMKCNLVNIGQFLEKNYKTILENKILKVYDADGKSILKTSIFKNRTFKIGLQVMEHRCLVTVGSRDEWLWHYRLGHLNFKDLNLMHKKRMVTSFP